LNQYATLCRPIMIQAQDDVLETRSRHGGSLFSRG
jgi:hypothetical protein